MDCNCTNCGWKGNKPTRYNLEAEFTIYEHDWIYICPKCGSDVNVSVTAQEAHKLPPSMKKEAMMAFCE